MAAFFVSLNTEPEIKDGFIKVESNLKSVPLGNWY